LFNSHNHVTFFTFLRFFKMKRNKITIVGAGNVGATAAHLAAVRGLGDICLLDIVDGVPQGKALDLQEAGPVAGFDCNIAGTNSYEETKDSDVVVMTAGLARKPGMTRDDLLEKNTAIIKSVTENVARFSPDSFIIVVTNPLDVMAYVAKEVSGFPKNRVIGMAGALDSARLRAFIAMELGVSAQDVQAFVMGGHGDNMLPLIRYSTVSGIPVTTLIPQDRLDSIVQRARDGGAEILKLLKTGSAYYAPSAAIVQMVESILEDRKRVISCSVYLEGEYGINGYYVGVPVKLGGGGVEEIIEIELTEDEKAQFERSADDVKAQIDKIKL
jgi:malate dehydrogenase